VWRWSGGFCRRMRRPQEPERSLRVAGEQLYTCTQLEAVRQPLDDSNIAADAQALGEHVTGFPVIVLGERDTCDVVEEHGDADGSITCGTTDAQRRLEMCSCFCVIAGSELDQTQTSERVGPALTIAEPLIPGQALREVG